MSHAVTVPELLAGHTVLDVECLDRIYLNGYVVMLRAGVHQGLRLLPLPGQGLTVTTAPLRPLMASDQPQAPAPLRQALRIIDAEVHRRLDVARLPAAV